MAGHSPYVSVTKTLIRINAAAVDEHLPDWVDVGQHSVSLSLSEDIDRLYVRFVEDGSDESDVFSLQQKERGLHTSTSRFREQIIAGRGVGRYDCWWDDDPGVLVVDLTEEVREPQRRWDSPLS